jgi:hypothetical protein
MFGQAGLGWKMPVGDAAELLFRCGPEMAYADPLRPDYGPDRQPFSYRPQWLRLEVTGRWPLLGPIGLECEGAVCPAIDPGERDALDRDLRLVFPMGKSGQWQLGTRRRWETGGDPKTGIDDRLFYSGFRFAW